MSLFNKMSRSVRSSAAADAPWLICEAAKVAENEDPDKQHRIKVIIPSIDEEMAYDDWVRPLTAFTMGDGFGLVSIPEKGSEVLIFGSLGQKFNLFYIGSAYNEETRKSERLDLETPGIDAPKNLAFFAALLMTMQAQNLQIVIQQLAHMQAENIEIFASSLAKMTGQTIQHIADQDLQLQVGQSLTINGNTVTANSDGSMTIHAGGTLNISGANVNVTSTGVLKLEGRTVNKAGPSI